MLTAYNNDNIRQAVFFDGFDMIRHELNNDKLVQNAYVRFRLTDIYYLDVGKGTVTATLVTDTTGLGDAYDSENWDFEPLFQQSLTTL